MSDTEKEEDNASLVAETRDPRSFFRYIGLMLVDDIGSDPVEDIFEELDGNLVQEIEITHCNDTVRDLKVAQKDNNTVKKIRGYNNDKNIQGKNIKRTHLTKKSHGNNIDENVKDHNIAKKVQRGQKQRKKSKPKKKVTTRKSRLTSKTVVTETRDKKFAKESSLQGHLATHAPDKDGYNCPHCESPYKRKTQLTLHLKRCHRDQLFNCHMCLQVFVDLPEYDEHVGSCQLFKCKSCDASFGCLQALKRHRLVHVNKEFNCNLCSARFENRMTLVRHMRLKHAPKKFCCLICDKKFMRGDHYQIHMRRHNNLKPYVCVTCGWAFCEKSDLNRHRKFLHLGCVRKKK